MTRKQLHCLMAHLLFLLLCATGLKAQVVVNISGANTATWTAPPGGGPYYVRITARGADGGKGFNYDNIPSNGGQGATMSGIFAVPAGQTILAISGAKGTNGAYYTSGGGGAGSGAVNASTGTLLLIAGGGSGGENRNKADGKPAFTYAGNGDGGKVCSVSSAGGGGGVNGPGESASQGGGGGGQVKLDGLSAGGSGYAGGGRGGSGMGGGGGASVYDKGPGGGQTGGSGCNDPAYSLPGGTCQNNIQGGSTNNPQNGSVTIELLVMVTYYRDADGDGYGNARTATTGPDTCPPSTGYVSNGTDCDDSKADIHPGAPEIVDDGIDQDCDGQDLVTYYTFYRDADGDGFGAVADTVLRHLRPYGYVKDSTDCDDSNFFINPQTVWVLDSDNDSYYTGNPVTGCTAPGAGYAVKTTQRSGDCNDSDAAINPGATDIPDDGIDQNCDGYDLKTWYQDSDGDGYGNAAVSVLTNYQPYKFVQTNGDCDDGNAAIHPGATEIAEDDIDQDCDGVDQAIFYRDADGDGSGNAADTVHRNFQPDGYVRNSADCNDSDAALDSFTSYYPDNDGDGFGDGSNPTALCSNTPPAGYVSNGQDCNDNLVLYQDNDGDGYGSAVKVACGGIENNQDCNDGDAAINPNNLWVLDADNDGYYTGNPVTSCASPGAGYVVKANQQPGDCRDTNKDVYPGAPEICGNGIDDNCNGQTDEGCSTATITAYILPTFTWEGNSGKRVMLFAVVLNKPATATVSVKYATVDGSAKAGADYEKSSGSVSFSKGQWLKFISVNVIGDKMQEANELFYVQLSGPSGVKLYGTGKATGTIFNDDGNRQNNIITAAPEGDLKEAPEVQKLVVPNLLHRSQVWRIPNLPARNQVVVVDGNGRVVLRATNYVGDKSFTNATPGVYFYNIVTSDEGGQSKTYRGKLMIVN